MLFNSLPFAAFFVVFFFLYWFAFNRNLRLQNLLILAGSYLFYSWWDYRFLSLLVAQSLLTYTLGFYIAAAKTQKRKRLLTAIGTIAGVGCLLYFKYTNFFITSFTAIFPTANIHTLTLILPLGISFYTFRTLSYLFDVNKGKIEPCKNWIVFFSYVAFFPCLLSGPIDKAKTLIPQLENKRVFNYNDAADAMRQILWGLFKKIVIADNLAPVTNQIFDHYHHLPGSTLLIGAFYFSVQLYADFSGYSDMAIGFAKLIGFNVTKNFDFPFFAQNIAEFWRKWHISLTTWLTDYIFTPLSISFRDMGKAGLILAIMINFTLIGIWHGANWTFVLFGFLHGCYYIPLILTGRLNKKKKKGRGKPVPSLKELINMLGMFTLVSLTFIIFRADTIGNAFGFIGKIFSPSLFTHPDQVNLLFIFLIIILLITEWIQRDKAHVLQIQHIRYIGLRWGIYSGLLIATLVFISTGDPAAKGFIYVKF
jgi:D-alanyl-lipoteichoic acid acyltransferase DltB (MBOAT superfamily)